MVFSVVSARTPILSIQTRIAGVESRGSVPSNINILNRNISNQVNVDPLSQAIHPSNGKYFSPL